MFESFLESLKTHDNKLLIESVKKGYQLIESYNDSMYLDINNNKFMLIDNDMVVLSQTYFNIEDPDEFFNEKYISIYSLETDETHRGKGYALLLLNKIFEYIKNTLQLNIITLIVDKDNIPALNLYVKAGFKKFIEYDDSYSLVKKL